MCSTAPRSDPAGLVVGFADGLEGLFEDDDDPHAVSTPAPTMPAPPASRVRREITGSSDWSDTGTFLAKVGFRTYG